MPIPTPADFRDRTKKHSQVREMLAQMAENVESKESVTEKVNTARQAAINAASTDAQNKANAAENKSPYIATILENTMVVEMLVQLSFDLRLIPPKDYAKAIEITGSLAKQAKGWKKYSERSRIQE